MADLASSPYFLLILFIAAFALPLVYLVWIRNSPRYGREPWPTSRARRGALRIARRGRGPFLLIDLPPCEFDRRHGLRARQVLALRAPVGRLPVLYRCGRHACDVQPVLDFGRRRRPAERYGRCGGCLLGRGEPCDCRDLRRAVEARLASVPHVTVRPGTSSRNVITPDGVQVGACAFVSKCRGTRTRRTRSPSSESSQGTGFVGVVVWTVHSGRAGANG